LHHPEPSLPLQELLLPHPAPSLPLQELLLLHLEPSLLHQELLLHRQEPSLHHLELSLLHPELLLHHQEPSLLHPLESLFQEVELHHQLELHQSPILNHPLPSTSTTFARDTFKLSAHHGKMPPDSLLISSDFTIPPKDQESSVNSPQMDSMPRLKDSFQPLFTIPGFKVLTQAMEFGPLTQPFSQ
jgi:hypothetical protein